MKRTSTRDAIFLDSAELKFADISGNQFPIKKTLVKFTYPKG